MSPVICPNCRNPVDDEDALLCHFCGGSLAKISSGILGAMRAGGMRWVLITIGLLLILAFLLTSGLI